MSIYYIENENGTYLSEDGKRKFIKLEGEKAYEYLKSKNKSKLRFFQTTTLDEKEKVFVEVPISDIQSSRKGERHKQYLDDCEKESGIVTLSIEDLPKNRDLSGEELLEDKTENTENTVFTTLELDALYEALHSLSPIEYEIINLLYLSKKPLNKAEIAKLLGISRQAASQREKRILKKLRKIFKK